MDKKIIFVGGVHGVGKTTLCKKITDELHIKHYSASQLIKKLKNEDVDNKDKRVKNIDSNQDLLIAAIDQYLDKSVLSILDGHFCLLNTKHEINRIPKETFAAISPVAIITLHDSIANIENKIARRDGIHYNVNLLSSFQDEEISYSADVANYLEIPHLLFDVSDKIEGLINFITEIIGRKPPCEYY
ncbi:MAG: AAA family ATPase [Deltaproteobacteria bacterium]|nr:AAA family ATPase [Candidatus Desulfobacula maris]